ncbi:hypothetical protein [Streptomyces sp. NPDC005533]|uniref:hypothetical protein n=1 Tax=Streptomyces sp. NPDC005533 TaxID=3364723 RepID=UPI00367936FD
MTILIVVECLILAAACSIAAFAVLGHGPSTRQTKTYYKYIEAERRRAQLRHPSSGEFQTVVGSAPTLVPHPRSDHRL